MKYAKKISAAVLAGCSAMLISSAAMAAPADNAAPPRYAQCWENTAPARPGDRRELREYDQQLQEKYSWMYADTRQKAARDLIAVDRALEDNKISQQQSDKLKKELISFYKDRQKYQDELRKLDGRDARDYEHQHRRHMSLRANMDELSQASGIPQSTLEGILRPDRDYRSRRDDKGRHGGPMYAEMEQIKEDLLSQGKVTRPEIDAIRDYLEKAHERFSAMDSEQRKAFIAEFKNMSDEQRIAKMADGTGINQDRLQSIFKAFKDAVEQRMDK